MITISEPYFLQFNSIPAENPIEKTFTYILNPHSYRFDLHLLDLSATFRADPISILNKKQSVNPKENMFSFCILTGGGFW